MNDRPRHLYSIAVSSPITPLEPLPILEDRRRNRYKP